MRLAGQRFASLSWVGAPLCSFDIPRAFESQLGILTRDGRNVYRTGTASSCARGAGMTRAGL